MGANTVLQYLRQAEIVDADTLNIGNPAVLARGATVPSDGATGYAKGCLFIKFDGTDHTNTLYCNIGSAASANFNLVTVASD